MTAPASTAPASAAPALSLISRWVRWGYLLPWLVLACGLLATFLLWQAAQHNVDQERRDYFDFRVREVIDKTNQRLQTYIQVLRGTRGLFGASHRVDREEFRNYISTLKLADHFPGIQGIGFALAISPAEKERHIAAVRSEGFPQYTIKPEGTRELYTSIIYIEPFAERNLRAFGYDMYSEPVRRAAMERARDTGLAAMSGKVLLVQEAQQNVQTGFLIYLPVYRNDRPHDTLAERRANLLGWVYAPFRIGDLIHGIYGEQAADLDIDIYDGNDSNEKDLMYDSHSDFHRPGMAAPQLTATRILETAGREWLLSIHPMPSFGTRINTEPLSLIAGGGIVTSLLLSLLVWTLAHSRRRAVRLAQQMNRDLIASERELRESEAKLQAILDNAAVAIGWADENGTIKYLNHKFTELFGYTLLDIPTVDDWYRHAYPDADYRNGKVAQWQTDIADSRINGHPIPPIELDIVCKDGSLRHAILTSAWVGSNILVSFSDITARKQAEAKLERWAHIFEHAEWGIVVGSADGKRIELANPAFAKARGYDMEELARLPIPELFAPDERTALPEHIRLAHDKGHHTFESRHLRKDGATFPVLVDITAVKDPQGRALYRVVNVQDISKLKAAEKALLDSRTVLQSILDNSPYMIWFKDSAGRFVAANKQFLASTGRREMRDILGKTDADLWPEHLARKYQADDYTVFTSRRQQMMEEQALDHGRPVWQETFKAPVFDAAGELIGITGFARDITERKLIEERVRHQAHYDLLTELPNRILFSDRLEQAIALAKRDDGRLAVMFLDLDRFKPVNDLFGHDIGDLLLREVAKRIHGCLRESDTVARIGGDEFCILLQAVSEARDATVVAEKILHMLRQPFELGGQTIHIGGSIGIALYPRDGTDEAALVKNADIAMYWAKESGRDSFVVFHSDMPSPVDE